MISAMTGFDIVNFPFLDVVHVPFMECIFHNLQGLLECGVILDDLNARNKFSTAKLLKQGYRHISLKRCVYFFKFYRRHHE